MKCRATVVLSAFAWASFAAAAWPPPERNLVLEAPIRVWDEAVPLGNGLMGGLLWGENDELRLSLDRGDLWDERTHGEADWWKKRTWAWGCERIAAGAAEEVRTAWDAPYAGLTPTKLPAGRLEIRLGPGRAVRRFALDLASAEGRAELDGGGAVRVFFSAAEPAALLHVPGPAPVSIDIVPSGARPGSKGEPAGVARLGYPPARRGAAEGRAWYEQAAYGSHAVYAASVRWAPADDGTVIAVAVATGRDGASPLDIAGARADAALAKGYDAMREPHAAWWRVFWAQSEITVPEPAIADYHALARYYYGAASRRGAPPMPLQGVWTADNGGLPPWKGDYHNDLNTQMTYIGYPTAGNFDEGACYLDFLHDLAPVFRAFARDFYGAPGLSTPGVMTLAGQPLGGWGQYSLSPTMTSWNAHLFYLHWRFTMDDAFLRDRAYPWCSAAGDCLRALLKPDGRGVPRLPLSSSPEIFDNTPRAWLTPNSTYDLMCMKMQFLALAEMADALGLADASRSWTATAAALGDLPVAPDGALLLDATTPLTTSHRHLSNLIGLYPFNLVTCEGGAEDVRRIRASLAQWEALGPGAWCGYSYAWMSALRARVGDAEGAMRHLDVFVKAFILRNGFHVNGDQTRSGFSKMTYRPFTLEGNFAALQAVHEMLLQSWSPTPGRRDTEVVRIFPATPWRWHDASFRDLRAEGGHRVSARRENNATTWLRVVAGRDGALRIRDNFGGRAPLWSRAGVRKAGSDFEIALKRGEAVEATLARPAAAPPAPADVAQPVAIVRPAAAPGSPR